jgi:hypothetical protein
VALQLLRVAQAAPAVRCAVPAPPDSPAALQPRMLPAAMQAAQAADATGQQRLPRTTRLRAPWRT